MEDKESKIFDALNDDAIDDFFNFREIRRAPESSIGTASTKTNKSVPKVKKPETKTPRNFSGTDYVKKYENIIQKDLVKSFGGLDLTGLSSGIALDDSVLFDTLSNIAEVELPYSDHRNDLPIFKHRDDIIRNIRSYPIVMISGPTGCGKSTQVPQYIFDDCNANHESVNILISQPRKIAAITLAQRVAHERDLPVGTVVGYQVGLNKCINLCEESTQMTYCTTGVVLQKLIRSKTCAQYSHIILDEVHERDLEIDFLITIIRRLNPVKSNTKIILMSATLDIEKFQDFWKIRSMELDEEFVYPPIIDLDASARKYEIVERYLDDMRKIEVSPDIVSREPGISHEMYSFAVQLILLILRSRDTPKKNILVFLPGLPEIERLQEEFASNEHLKNFCKFEPEIHVLHSSLSMEEQKLAFVNTNKTKIILATNIAESSVTIPNVAYVIDFCLTKFLRSHKGSQISSFVLGWASKNNCKQRAGRTGRVGRGTVFRLVYKDFYQRNLLEHSPPEIQTAPLESIVVKIKEFNMGSPLEVLAGSLDPPDQSAIINAVLAMKEHGGLLIHDENNNFDYHDGELTFLGEIMAALPCDIRITKLIVLGYMFSVLDEAIIIAAGLNFKAIFINSLSDKMGSYCLKMKWSEGTGSDCLATFNAYTYWFEHHSRNYFKSPEDERAWCRENGLDVKNLNEMRLWISEVKKRLRYFKIETLPFPNQPRWSPKEKILVLKTVMAGAFGVSNFFVTDSQLDLERDAFQILYDMDIFRTVYFRNMDRSIVGDVYKKQLKETFIKKGVCDEKSRIDIIFDRVGSERVYVTFEDNHLQEDDLGFGSGQIVPEVYKAVKLSKLQGRLELSVMSAQETMSFAIERGYGVCEQSQFQINYPTIEHPEYWPYPTRSTSKMRGYITHVEHCNKFFFCPLIAYNTKDDLPDRRYENVLKNIKSLLKTTNLTPVKADKLQLDHEKLVSGQVVVYKNSEAKEYERAILNRYVDDKVVEITVMDRGLSIEVPLRYIYTIQNDAGSNKLKAFPPRIFECKLKEIEPSCMQTYGNKWSCEAVEYFRNNVIYKDAMIKIFSIVNDIVIVDLKTFDGDVSTYWNSKLVDCNFAQTCEESYGSKVCHEKRSYDFLTLDKPQDPKAEFESIVDKNFVKFNELDTPELKKCDQVIKLVGPYSPLETNLRAVSGDISGYVRVDASSINHVLLHDEILSLHSKFYVAADISLGAKNQNVKIRETTAMPNIPGLSVLLALVFSPVAQLRRDKEMTRYVSIITGLGLDEEFQKPYFHERDALQTIDINLSEEDISDINRLRFAMSSMLYRDPFHELPNLNDRQREQLLKNIKEAFLVIINKKHQVRDVQMAKDHFKWNVDQEDAIRATSRIGHNAIWDYISIPPLNEMPYIMKEKLIKHVKDLENPAMNTYTKECKLCGKPFNNPNDLKLHLISKFHLIRKQQLGI